MQSTRQGSKKIVKCALLFALLLATGATAHAKISVNPSPMNFGSQTVGVANPSMAATLTNNTLSSIKIVGVSLAPIQFSCSGASLPITLRPGQSLIAAVTFTPTAAQAYSGTLTFTRADGKTVTDNLSGLGIQTTVQSPYVTTQPASQAITAGQTATFSVTATGTAPLSYQWRQNGTAISGATSSTYTTPAETISASGTQFTVVVSNSAGNETSSAAILTVNAVPPGRLVAGAPALSFGNVNISSSSSLGVTFTNSGSSNITISNVTISGPGFTASGVSAGLIVTSGQIVTLNVTFAPAATGSATGSVSVVSNASNSPASITLTGIGVAPISHSGTLTWNASTSTVIGYDVYRGTASGGPYTKINSLVDATTTFTDTTVQAGQTYYWVVTAVNSSNVQSTYSNQASGTIPTP